MNSTSFKSKLINFRDRKIDRMREQNSPHISSLSKCLPWPRTGLRPKPGASDLPRSRNPITAREPVLLLARMCVCVSSKLQSGARGSVEPRSSDVGHGCQLLGPVPAPGPPPEERPIERLSTGPAGAGAASLASIFPC